MFTLSAAHNRRQQLDLRALRQFHDLIDHLVNRLLFDLFSTLRAVRHTDPRVEKSEVIVDLRHCSHRRAGIAVRRLLIDRDCRRQSLNLLDIRLFHLPEELPCIGRQRLHIAPLTFGIDCIKCEGRFSRSRQSGQHDKFISRNIHINIFEVVLIRSSDFNIFSFGCFLHCLILSTGHAASL